MLISVLIATYNRCDSLKKMVDSFFLQQFDNSYEFELLLIDNNSTDSTKSYVNELIQQHKTNVRYIFEPRQGKSNALNTAIASARGEILAFTDDDVVIDINWLNNIARFARENEFDAVGGKVVPVYPANTPQWIKDYKNILNGPIVNYDNGDSIQKYDGKLLPFIGANMVIKKNVFESLGDFNVEFGPGAGTMGEDTAIFRKIFNNGKTIYYVPDVLVAHPVERSRITLTYIANWSIGMGQYYALKEINAPGLIKYFGVPRYLYWAILKILFKMIIAIFNKRKLIQLYLELFLRIGMIKKYRSHYKDSLRITKKT